jgi:AraC-like DNA-binding protein
MTERTLSRSRIPPRPPAGDAAQHAVGRMVEGILLERYRYPPGPAGATPGHSHQEYQLCLGFGPPTRYRYRGGWHLVPSGSLSILMPDEVHETVEAEDRTEPGGYRVLYVDPGRFREVAAQLGDRRTGLPTFAEATIGDPNLIARFLGLHASFYGPATQLGRDVRLLSLLTALVDRHAGTRVVHDTPAASRRAARIARSDLEDNYAANITLEELAGVTGLSAFHLARLFQREVGMPPHAYQIQVRITRAKRMLLHGLPVSRVASETGFFDLSHFTRHFKRYLGVPPGRYAFVPAS